MMAEPREVWKNALWANVMVTTACDRECPDCCEGDVVLRAKGRVFSPESIAADIAALGAVGFVTLTGGEPTLHPRFEEVAHLAYDSVVLNPAIDAIPDGLRDKHFFRKHGSDAYYGQTTKR